MAIIELPPYRGTPYSTQVDGEYLDYLSQFSWRLHNDHGRAEVKKTYVHCDASTKALDLIRSPTLSAQYKEGKRAKIRLHRLVFCHHNGLDLGLFNMVIDHINNDGLDNRLINLRQASVAQNNYNKQGQKTDHGVYRVSGGYKARISHKGKKIADPLVYPSKRLAKIAYDRLALKYQGVYAKLHYPNGTTKQETLPI